MEQPFDCKQSLLANLTLAGLAINIAHPKPLSTYNKIELKLATVSLMKRICKICIPLILTIPLAMVGNELCCYFL